MNTGELLAMPEADAITALADETNWPPGIIGVYRREWRKMTAQERLQWLLNVEETVRTLDLDTFRQWQARLPRRGQARGPTGPRRGSSIPRRYRQIWRDNARRLRNG